MSFRTNMFPPGYIRSPGFRFSDYRQMARERQRMQNTADRVFNSITELGAMVAGRIPGDPRMRVDPGNMDPRVPGCGGGG